MTPLRDQSIGERCKLEFIRFHHVSRVGIQQHHDHVRVMGHHGRCQMIICRHCHGRAHPHEKKRLTRMMMILTTRIIIIVIIIVIIIIVISIIIIVVIISIFVMIPKLSHLGDLARDRNDLGDRTVPPPASPQQERKGNDCHGDDDCRPGK